MGSDMRCRTSVLAVMAALVALLAGCNAGSISMAGNDTDAGPSGDTAGSSARDVFEARVQPLLAATCASCHAAGTGAPIFLAPDPDVYTSVTGWPALVNRRDPGSSRLLTKGEHAGPAWTGAQAAIIRGWLDVEAMESVDDGPAVIVTEPHALVPGANRISLEPLGIPATALDFIAEETPAGWYLSEVRVLAGPMGARLVHPVLIQWDGAIATADVADRFSGVEVHADPYTAQPLGGGTASLVGVPSEVRLSFSFDEAGPLVAPPTDGDAGVPGGDGGTGGLGGCRSVAMFTEHAQPQFAASCVTCHGGRVATARSALDMSEMFDPAADAQERACNQILGRIVRSDPAASNIFSQPDPSVDNDHDFHFDDGSAFESFRSAVLRWFATE